MESFNWKSTERTIKNMEGTVWNIDIGVLKKSSNFFVPYSVLYRGRVGIRKGGRWYSSQIF